MKFNKPELFITTLVLSFFLATTAHAESKTITIEQLIQFSQNANCLYDSSYKAPTLLNIKKSIVCEGINDKNLKPSAKLVKINKPIATKILQNIEPKYLMYALEKLKKESPLLKKQ